MKTALVVVIVVVYFQQLMLSISAQYGDEIETVRDEWLSLRKDDSYNFEGRMHTLILNVKHLVDKGLITPKNGEEYKWKYGFYQMDYCLPGNKYVGCTTTTLPAISQWQESQSYLNKQKLSETDKKSDDFIKRFYEKIQSDNEKDKPFHPVDHVETPLKTSVTDSSTKPGQTYSEYTLDVSSSPNSYGTSPEKTTISKSDNIFNKASETSAGPSPSSPYHGPAGHHASDVTLGHPQSSTPFIPLSYQSSNTIPIPNPSSSIYVPQADDGIDLTPIPPHNSPSNKLTHDNSDTVLDHPPSFTSVKLSAPRLSDITLSPPPLSSTSFIPMEHKSTSTAPAPPPNTDSDKSLAQKHSELILGHHTKSNSFFTVPEVQSYETIQDHPPSSDSVKPLTNKNSDLTHSPPDKPATFRPLTPETSKNGADPLIHSSSNNYQKPDPFESVSTDSRSLQTPDHHSSSNSKISYPVAVRVSFSSKVGSGLDASLIFPAPRNPQTDYGLQSTGFASSRSRRGRGRGPWN